MSAASEELNTLILRAIRDGYQPFRCVACREWVLTEPPSRRHARLICRGRECRSARNYYLKTGRDWRSEREHAESLWRAVWRAIDTGELGPHEIAQELGIDERRVYRILEHGRIPPKRLRFMGAT